jgi:hypothetical protein
MNEQGFAGIGVLVEKGFDVVPAGWKSLPQARFLWDEAVRHSKAAKEKGATGTLAGMIITCWREVTNELLDEYLQALKDRVQDEEKQDTVGVASSAVYMADALKDYKPI